jgi:streptomycin 6-kinase
VIDLPDPVAHRARQAGAAGARWLRELPGVVRALEARWGVSVGRTMHGGTASYVAEAARADGSPAVLKVFQLLDVTGVESYEQAVVAMRLAGGRGCVELLEADDEHHAVLLERLGPDLDSLGLPVDEQLRHICSALQELWRPVPDGVELTDGPTKARWLGRRIEEWWDATGRPCTERTVETVLRFCTTRAAAFDRDSSVLVHGDAHSWNTLAAGSGRWKLVDIEGLISSREHDLAVPMRELNEPLLAGDPLVLGLARARRLADLTGTDPEAIWQWGSIERVATALYSASLDQWEWATPFLEVADAWSLRT